MSSFIGKTILRTVAFLPFGTSVVALAIIWWFIYSPNPSGVFNSIVPG